MNRAFGPYDISQELGRGAMGVVYLAVHRNLQRQCALKTIALKFKDPRAADRFIFEGQAVAKLGKHPNIVQVFDAGIVDKTPYIAMEFVQGETLDTRVMQRGHFPEAELIEIGRKLALALDHAHRRGIVHRDVKLANVIIDEEGEPQLLDFGISKDLNVSRTVLSDLSVPVLLAPSPTAVVSATQSNSDTANDATFLVSQSVSTPSLDEGIQGTPAFMAPEQADPRRGPVDARSDVYALGVTLYVLATARRPFEAATMTELLLRVITERPTSPRDFADISLDLDAVILKSLEKDPADRYQTALEFADDLSRVTTGVPTRARKLGRLGWLWRRLRVHGKLLAIAAGFLVFAAIVSGYFVYRAREIQALWGDIAERTARATVREVDSLLDPALPMLEECVSLAESGLLPLDDQDLLGRHLVARFRFQTKLSWLSYGDANGRFTGAWRHPSGRIVVQRSWWDDLGGHVREQLADGDGERLRWNDEWTYDPRERPYYRMAAAASHPIWTKPYEWFGAEGLGITSAFALRDRESNEVRGVFTADYHLGTLADFLANLKLGKGGRAFLLGRGGELLASPDRGAIVGDDLLVAAIRSGEATLGGIQSLPLDEPGSFSFRHDGKAYVAAIEAFEPAEGLPIITLVLVPEEDITGPVKATAIRTAEIALSVAVLAVLATVLAGIYQKRKLILSLAQRKRTLKQNVADSSLEKTHIDKPVDPKSKPVEG